MKRLLANELMKIRYSRSVKAVFFILVFFVFFTATIQAGDGGELGDYGFHIPFINISTFGAMGSFIYAVLAAAMIGGEFENGLVHNILGCGIGRRGYYVAKQAGVYGVAAVIYLMVMLLHTLVITLRFGFGPKELIGEKYWLEVLVYTVAALIWLAANLSVYCFLAFLLRKAALTFVVCVGWGIADVFLSAIAFKNGRIPMLTSAGITNNMVARFQAGEVLAMEFCKLFLPCIVIILVCNIAGYWLFLKRDIR